MDYVICPLTQYAGGPGGRLAWKPKVHVYAQDITIVSMDHPTLHVPLRPWTLVRVESWQTTPIDGRAAALVDPDCIFINAVNLDQPLGAFATSAQATLNLRFNCGAAFTPTMTVRDAIDQLGKILDPAFDATIWAL